VFLFPFSGAEAAASKNFTRDFDWHSGSRQAHESNTIFESGMDVANKRHEDWSRLQAAFRVGLSHLQGRRARGNKLYNQKDKEP
jgi:hypothetical protein